MQLLSKKVALVTGATRGIGKGIALSFAKNGANIAFTYVSSDDKARALEQELQKGTKVMPAILKPLTNW
jgi:3-oxoacyl-[acyl-carrier protein] reductase